MKSWLVGVALCILPLVSLAERLPVVASFSIIADMTREIGGDRIDVVSLVGPNQDVHVFQPSPADVKRLSQAKVFVINGLGLEGWLDRLSKSANFRGVQIRTTLGMAPIRDDASHEHDEPSHSHGDDGHHHEVDPHAWHDPRRVQVYIRNITNGLIQADPAGKAVYQKHAANFLARTRALDQWAANAFAAIAEARRKVVTAHHAFAYLGDRYHIRFLAPQGMSTETEASAKNVAKLVRQLRQEKVKTIFSENMTDQRLLLQIASEAGVHVSSDKLYADALSEQGGVADSWQKMFRYNVETILKSFS